MNDYNPFSKGAMAFDDFNYKYFNEVILNAKAIKALNDDIEDDISTIQPAKKLPGQD